MAENQGYTPQELSAALEARFDDLHKSGLYKPEQLFMAKVFINEIRNSMLKGEKNHNAIIAGSKVAEDVNEAGKMSKVLGFIKCLGKDGLAGIKKYQAHLQQVKEAISPAPDYRITGFAIKPPVR